MIPRSIQSLCSTTHEVFSECASPIKRDIAAVIDRAADCFAAAFRLKHSRRKIDLARHATPTYDDSIDRAIGTEVVSREGWLSKQDQQP